MNDSVPTGLTGTSHYATQKNREKVDKPNEDYAIVDDIHAIYIVCDGVTRHPLRGPYPRPSPAARAARLLAETAHQALVDHVAGVGGSPTRALREAVRQGNAAIAAFNRQAMGTIDYLENDFASTVALVGLVAGETFHYAYAGDCLGYHVSRGHISRFTYPQTARVAAYREAVGPDEADVLTVRRELGNNPAHPYGFGAFTGEPVDIVAQP